MFSAFWSHTLNLSYKNLTKKRGGKTKKTKKTKKTNKQTNTHTDGNLRLSQ